MPPGIPEEPDVILAADCVYFEPAFPLLLETMRELIGQETVCYFCFSKRMRADKDMTKMLGKVFEVEAIKGPVSTPSKAQFRLFYPRFRHETATNSSMVQWEKEQGVLLYEIRREGQF